MIRIRLFGGLSVTRDDRRVPAPAATQPRRQAILAIIAHSGARGVSRDRLHTLFWPDADEDVARRGLTQALYSLRTGLDAEQLFHGVRELRLNRDVAACDVLEYIDAIEGGELERAADLYQGPFLDGFRVPGLPDFDRRVDEERDALARRHESLIERLAQRATERGENERAVEWWRQRAAMDPLNARVAEAYVRALAAAGDRVGAIRHARVHEQIVRQEFGNVASSAVTTLAEQLRVELESLTAAPNVSVSHAANRATSSSAGAHDELSAQHPPLPATSPSQFPAPVAAAVAERATTVAPLRTRSVGVLAILAIALAATALIFLNTRRASTARMDDANLANLRVSAPRRIAADAMFELDPAISPDGRHIAYVAGDEGAMRVYVRQLDGSQAIAIAESVAGDQRRPRWSPDGTSIVFQAARGIWIVPALGGTAGSVVEPPTNHLSSATSPTWSPDGSELAFVVRDTIYRMPPRGGARRVVASVANAHSLAWSPDGQWIAAASGNADFDVGAQADGPRAGVGIGNLAPSAIVLVATADLHSTQDAVDSVRVLVPPTTLNASPAWLDQRTLVFVSSRGGTRDLFAVHISDDGIMLGNTERITAGLDVHSVSASRDGQQLAYAVFRQSANVWSLPLRSNAPMTLATATRVTEGTQVVEGLDVSNDGRWLAFDSDVSGQQDIFRLPIKDGAPTSRDAERIVSSSVDDFHPAWSPDAEWIAFYTFRGSVRRAAYVRAAGGAARLVQPNGPNVEEHSPIWSSDGKSLMFFRNDSGQTNLYRADRINDTTWTPSRRVTKSGGLGASFSADGKQMMYFSAPGTIRLTDSSFHENTSHVLLAPAQRAVPIATSGRITPDGRALIVKGYDTTSSGFWWYPIESGATGTPRVLVRFDNPHRNSPRPEFASDGRFIYFTLAEREADVWAVRLERR